MPAKKSTTDKSSGTSGKTPERGTSGAAATERNEGRNKGTPTSSGREPIQKRNKTTSNA